MCLFSVKADNLFFQWPKPESNNKRPTAVGVRLSSDSSVIDLFTKHGNMCRFSTTSCSFLLQNQPGDSKHTGASAALSRQRHTLEAAMIPSKWQKKRKKKGISSLTEDGKPGGTFRTFFVWTSERERKATKQYVRVLTGHFYFLLNRSFWFDLLGFNRSAREERARPLLPPASIHLQRVLSLHQARHNKMQKIKRQSTKRTGLIFFFFFSWSVW